MPRSEFYLPQVDMRATVALLALSEGGMREPFALTAERAWFRGSLMIDTVNYGFDVRMEPDTLAVDTLLPGCAYRMQMLFLSPVEAKLEFNPGRQFEIWHGRLIGTGKVGEAPFNSLEPA